MNVNINWKMVFREGLLTGTFFCVAILAYLRISPALSAGDYPAIVKNEIFALENYRSTLYEQILVPLIVFMPLVWGMFRILTKLDVALAGKALKNRYLSLYLGVLVWNLVIFNMDLIFVDWLIICYLKAPISGIEHLLSAEAIQSYQSYSFHFHEHYMFMGSYLVNILFPVVAILIYDGLMRLYKRFAKTQVSAYPSL